jgi:hypothetical protein
MEDIVRRVEYYYARIPDRSGEGARILSDLKAAGANLVAFNGSPTGVGRAQIDFVPSDKNAFLAAAQQEGLKLVGPKIAFMIQGRDRAGAVAEILSKLGQARISVTAILAVASGAGSFGAILWVKPRRISKAAQALGIS